MNESIAIDVIEVNRLLRRFMQSFDEKDWQKMRGCLSESVFCDYSSFRGTPPGVTSADDYVAQRRAALSDLAMQHDIHDVNVDVDGDLAKARCNYAIRRFRPDPGGGDPEFFHSYGHYEFTLRRQAGEWRIDGITQHLLANLGNPAIHGARRSSEEEDR